MWALLEIAVLALVVGWIVWMVKPPKRQQPKDSGQAPKEQSEE